MTSILPTLVKETHSRETVRDTVMQIRYSNNMVAVAKAQDTRPDCFEHHSLLIEMKRVQKKVDVVRRDIINSLPTQIRKTIGHIEFAKPLDNSHGRG